MQPISAHIPNHEDLLRLEPEQLAGILLEILLAIDGGDRQFLNRHNFFNANPDLLRGYPLMHGSEIQQAVFEAWMWLEREGFLVPRINDPHGLWVDISRRGRRAAGRAGIDSYRHAAMLPRPHLHARFVATVYPSYLRGDYDAAVFQAFKEVEVAVRNAAQLSPEDLGCQLMRKAFDPKGGSLTDHTQVPGERQAISDLFAGAIGLYKNPSSHRSILMTPTRAVEAIMLASQLLNLVDNRRSATAWATTPSRTLDGCCVHSRPARSPSMPLSPPRSTASAGPRAVASDPRAAITSHSPSGGGSLASGCATAHQFVPSVVMKTGLQGRNQ